MGTKLESKEKTKVGLLQVMLTNTHPHFPPLSGECDTLRSHDYCLFRMCFPCCSSRGSSLSFMKTGGRRWLARAARFSVCWTSKGTTSLCWMACLRTSRPDRFTYYSADPRACPECYSECCFYINPRAKQHHHSPFLLPQAFWAPGDTGVVFVGWRHEPFRLGLKYCPNRP